MGKCSGRAFLSDVSNPVSLRFHDEQRFSSPNVAENYDCVARFRRFDCFSRITWLNRVNRLGRIDCVCRQCWIYRVDWISRINLVNRKYGIGAVD